MAIIDYIKQFPARTLPVRKELARAGWCPECGKSLGRKICSDANCMFDATALIGDRELQIVSTDE